jgi:hypothetical protein
MNYTPYMPRFPLIREPGLPAFEPGTERYKVSGGGAIVAPIFRGDRVTVDREAVSAARSPLSVPMDARIWVRSALR